MQEASRELRDALEDEAAPAEQIGEHLEAYRDAREEAEDNLESARGELKELLTPRQEAMLVLAGMLE